MFIIEAIKSQVAQVRAGILKLSRVHFDQLTQAVQEKQKVRAVVLTIIQIRQRFHLILRDLQIKRQYLTIDLLTTAPQEH